MFKIFAILTQFLGFVAPIATMALDKSLAAFSALVPIVLRYASRFGKIFLWTFGITFLLNLSSTLLAFTFYHLGMTIVIALASYCTIFTVTSILNAVLALIVLSIVIFGLPLIG